MRRGVQGLLLKTSRRDEELEEEKEEDGGGEQHNIIFECAASKTKDSVHHDAKRLLKKHMKYIII